MTKETTVEQAATGRDGRKIVAIANYLSSGTDWSPCAKRFPRDASAADVLEWASSSERTLTRVELVFDGSN